MKVAKYIQGNIILVDVENGMEVGGERTEEELYADGYKKACGDGVGEGEWKEYPTCFVFVETPQTEPTEEITAEEALEIITGGTL